MTSRYYSSLLLLFAGFGVAFLLCEGVIALYFPQNLSGTWLTKSKNGYPINAVRHAARHQFEERVVHYSINELHLRGPLPRKDLQNVLLLGDSFTFGWLLNEEDTLRAQLQKIAAKEQTSLHFLNGGVGGSGTSQQLAFLEEFGQTISPRKVIVIFNVDDIERSLRLGNFVLEKDRSLRAIMLPRQNALFTKIKNSTLYQFSLEHSHLFQLARTAIIGIRRGEKRKKNTPSWTLSSKQRDSSSNNVQLGQALFERMSNWCKQHNAELWVTTTGWFHKGSEKKSSALFLKEAAKFFQEKGISFHDISPEFQKIVDEDSERYYIPNDGHPNEYAIAMISKLIWSNLFE